MHRHECHVHGIPNGAMCPSTRLPAGMGYGSPLYFASVSDPPGPVFASPCVWGCVSESAVQGNPCPAPDRDLPYSGFFTTVWALICYVKPTSVVLGPRGCYGGRWGAEEVLNRIHSAATAFHRNGPDACPTPGLGGNVYIFSVHFSMGA